MEAGDQCMPSAAGKDVGRLQVGEFDYTPVCRGRRLGAGPTRLPNDAGPSRHGQPFWLV